MGWDGMGWNENIKGKMNGIEIELRGYARIEQLGR